MARSPHQIFGDLVSPPTRKAASASATKTTAQLAESMPESIIVEGYYLGDVDYGGKQWMLLYRDRARKNWILIPSDAEVGFERDAVDPALPDTVWVKQEATVCFGRGARSIELMFLSGSLTTAGELDQTMGSRGGDMGLFDPQSPPLCGCGKKTR